MDLRVLVTGVALTVALHAWSAAPAPARDPACPFLETQEPLLNSERIERCFGSYAIELLEPHDGLRIARLASDGPGGRVTRTLAITEFEQSAGTAGTAPVQGPAAMRPAVGGSDAEADTQLRAALARIHRGGSIGATLASAGWAIRKTRFAVAAIRVESAVLDWAGMPDVQAPATLAADYYRLSAYRNGLERPVARIAEFHHPEYMTLTDLRALPGAAPNSQALEPPDAAFRDRALAAMESGAGD